MPAFDRRRVLSLAGSALAGALGAGRARGAPPARARELRKALGLGRIGAGATLGDEVLLARDCGLAG